MSRATLGRRGALSGGLAVALAVAVAPSVSHGEGIDRAALAGQDKDPAEEDSHDPPFLAAFLGWLRTEAGRMALPVSVDTAAPSRIELRVHGVHPAIRIPLDRHCEINVGVMWEEKYRNALLWLDAHEEPGPDGVGWINSGLYSELEVVHPTREALWRADLFEPLLTWINEDLAQATHLAMWEMNGSPAWAHLLRDGKISRWGWTTEENREAPVHLVRVHGHPA